MNLNELLYGTRERMTLDGRIQTVINNVNPNELDGEDRICLDLGCASGSTDLCDTVNGYGYSYYGMEIRKTPDTVNGDIYDTPFKTDSADLITCIDVIEHLTLWQKAVEEMYRVLKVGGLLYLHFPIYFIHERD